MEYRQIDAGSAAPVVDNLHNADMSPLSFDHDVALAAFDGQLAVLVQVAAKLDPADLLAPTRCRGWLVLDLLTHVRLGLEEMLRGCTAPTRQDVTCDAASYWREQAPGMPGESGADSAEVESAMYLRRVASAYSNPGSAVHHLVDAVDAVRVAADGMATGPVRFQGHVLSSGDFLATWAVELVIHHLDLGLELRLPVADADAVRLTRATLDALAGAPLPRAWDDETAVLVATGRRTPSADEAAALSGIGVWIPLIH